MAASSLSIEGRAGVAAFGALPPLRLRETRHPTHDRRGVSLRWLGATLAFSLAAALLLWGVLHGTARQGVRVAAPEFAATRDAPRIAEAGIRTDRMVRRPTDTQAGPSPVRETTLLSSGLGDRPLTVLSAALDRMDDWPAPATPDAPASPAVSVPLAALPSAILFGGAAPAGLPSRASGYAPLEASLVEPGVRGIALNVTAIPRASASASVPDREDRIVAQKGDTIGQALAPFRFTPAEIADLGAALLDGGSGTRFAGGEQMTLRWPSALASARPSIIQFRRPDTVPRAAALADDGRYRAMAQAPTATPAEPAVLPAAADQDNADAASGADSLQEAIGRIEAHGGAEPALAANVLRVLGAASDLGRAVASGDRLTALYETPKPGDPGDQTLDFAALTRKGRTLGLYRFVAPDDGSTDYYDGEGRAVMKFLLRKPVANGVLGDGFGWRIHPVLHDRRFHEGVDYRAPYGSPIVAAGAGTVEKIGFETGYGKYIRVIHDLGYETTYAHVSSFGRAMMVGKRVQQGETIAYVGSTGYSTGPHLYYEVRINGRNVDPLTVRLAGGRMLQGPILAQFATRRDRIDTLVKASLPNAPAP